MTEQGPMTPLSEWKRADAHLAAAIKAATRFDGTYERHMAAFNAISSGWRTQGRREANNLPSAAE